MQSPLGGCDAVPWCFCGPQKERCTAWSVPSTPCSALPAGPAGWITADLRTGELAIARAFTDVALIALLCLEAVTGSMNTSVGEAGAGGMGSPRGFPPGSLDHGISLCLKLECKGAGLKGGLAWG